MADDEVGGIRAEVTADLTGLESGLQKASQLIRTFNEQFGHITVQIHAAQPTQQQLRDTHALLQRNLTAAGILHVPLTVGVPTEQQIREAHTATGQKIAQVAAANPAARAAQVPVPVHAAPLAAEVVASPQLVRSSRGPGSPDVYRMPDGSLKNVYPQSAGTPVGGQGGFGFQGQQLGPSGGPREFLGGQGFNIPGLQEELGQLRRQNEELRARLAPEVGGGGYDPYKESRRREMRDLRRRGANYTPPNVRRSLREGAGFEASGEDSPESQANADAALDAMRLERANELERRRSDRRRRRPLTGEEGLLYELYDSARQRGLSPLDAINEANASLRALNEDDPFEEFKRQPAVIAAGGGGGGGGGGRRRPPAAGPQPEDEGQIEPRAGLSQAQIEARRRGGLARAASAVRGPGGTFLSNAAAAAQIQRPPVPETRAAEGPPLDIEVFRPTIPSGVEGERLLRMANGEIGTPAEQAEARSIIGQVDVGSTRRGGRGRGSGGPTGPKARLSDIDPERITELGQINPNITAAQEQIRLGRELQVQAQAGVQQRSLGTFITGLLQAGTGRPASVIAIREFGQALTSLEKSTAAVTVATDQFDQAETRLGKAQRDGKGNITALTEAREKALAQLGQAEHLQEEDIKRVQRTGAALGEQGSALRGLAAGFAGGIAGSLAYGVGITAVTGAIELFTRASQNGVEVLTGHVGKTQQITGALSDQTRAQHGLVEATVAASFAQSGLSENVAGTIRPYIEQRVAIEAGSKALSDQIDLIHAAVNIQEQQRRGGGIPGISAPTGGFLGTSLFAQPGAVEQLARLTPGGQQREAAVAGGVGGALAGALTGAGIGAFGGPFGIIPGLIGGAIIGGLGGAGLAGALNAPGGNTLSGVGQRGNITIGGGRLQNAGAPDIQASLDEVNPRLEAFNLSVRNLNEAAERGTPNVQSLAQAVTGVTDPGQLAQTQRILEGLDVPKDQRDNLREAGFVLQNLGSGPFSQQLDKATKFFEAATRGAAIPAPEEALENLRTRIIPARIFQALATTQLQQNLINTQAGIARAAQPFLPLGTSIPGGVGATSPFVQRQLGFAGGLDALNVQRIEAARVEISQLAAPLGSAFQQGALGSFDRLQGLGQRAAGLQSFITSSQVGLQTAQFDEQIRLQRLQLTDLAQLTGRIGATSGDNLGLYQRQLITLQRQSAELTLHTQQLGLQGEELNQQLATLQLELQQRQINFSVAVAGFTAPGTTPEERAARIDEAEREAKFAQRQLDIRKELLRLQKQILQDQRQQVQIQTEAVPLQFKIQDITFDRDYITARNALNLLTRARKVNIDVAGAQEALQRINAEIEVEQARLNEYVKQAAEFQGQLISDQAEFIATYTNSTRKLLSSAENFLDGISTAYSGAITDYLRNVVGATNAAVGDLYGAPTSNVDPATGRPRQSGPQEFAQQGFLGMTRGLTSFVAGEVQGEAVAILKNPREMMGGMGGGTQINFHIEINNPVIKDEGDIERLSRAVADAVEQRISRRISLQGFRPSLS